MSRPWPTISQPRAVHSSTSDGIALGDRGVHRHAGADAVPVERLHDAEDADAVAVVAQRVVAQVRVGGRAARPAA